MSQVAILQATIKHRPKNYFENPKIVASKMLYTFQITRKIEVNK